MSQIATLGVNRESDKAAAPKKIVASALEVIRAHGFEAPEASEFEAPEYADICGGLTPEYANEARKMDNRGCFDHMDLADTMDGLFGPATGSEPVTTLFNRAGYTVAEATEALCERGHVATAITKVANELTGDIDPEALPESERERIEAKAAKIVAYKVAEFAKGWVAEKVISASEAYKKASASNDKAEQDLWADVQNGYVQVKSVTLGYKPNGTIEKSDKAGITFQTTDNGVPVLFYQWDCDGHLVLGFDHKAVNKAAADVKGERATTIARTHSAYTHDGRTYRKLWW